MLLIRISAAVAVLYALFGIVAFFIPLFYNAPFQFSVDDVVPAITDVLLLAGAFVAILYAHSSVLAAAWAWTLALQASAFVHAITHPHDFTLAILRFGNAQTRENARQLFEQAHEVDLHIRMVHLVVPLIALILVMVGQLQVVRKPSKV
jgi:hypothetical protein